MFIANSVGIVLQIPRSTYYYESRQKPEEDSLASDIREIFRQSRNNYGTRKIKVELAKKNRIVSRRRIGRIMKQEGQAYETLEQLQYELEDYVNWFNKHRIHSSLGYLTPKEYRLIHLKKLSEKVLTIISSTERAG